MTKTSTVVEPAAGSPRSARRGSYLEQLLADRSRPLPVPPRRSPTAPTMEDPQTPTQTADPSPGAPAIPEQQTSAGLSSSDAAAVEAAGALTAARHHPCPVSEEEDPVEQTAAATEDCIAACTRTASPPTSPEPMNWDRFGTVIPVLAGSPGAGASVLAVVLADALATQGRRVLLVDAADPLRSGLSLAADTDGSSWDGPHPGVRIRSSDRGPIQVRRLEYRCLPVRSTGMVPAPRFWAPPAEDSGPGAEVTVVDVGWDAWPLAALPLHGPVAWLRSATPAPRPLLALRPNAPGVRAAEQLLGRLAPWSEGGGASRVAAVAVMGAHRLPRVVGATAGMHLTPLLADAVVVPTDRSVGEHGITADPTPSALQHAVTPLLARWNLLAAPATPPPAGPRRLLRLRKPPPSEGNDV